MRIEILEEQIKEIQDAQFKSIIELIIDAVSDFPLHGITETELYFNEVKKLIMTSFPKVQLRTIGN